MQYVPSPPIALNCHDAAASLAVKAQIPPDLVVNL
jgi:hypothetical protein